jgi:hypothetical protein
LGIRAIKEALQTYVSLELMRDIHDNLLLEPPNKNEREAREKPSGLRALSPLEISPSQRPHFPKVSFQP